MKKYYLIILCTVFFTKSYSQLFFQDFSAGNKRLEYIGTEKNQFLTISNFKNSPSAIENKQLIFEKKSGSSSFFATQYKVSTATKLTFDIDVTTADLMSLNESHRGNFLIGGGADENWKEASPKQPQKERVHTRVMFNVSYTENNTPQYSFANSKTQFKGKKRVTIISNNTGNVLKYKGPNNQENIVKDGGYDLWVNDVLVMNDATAIGKNTTLEYLKFVYPPKAPNCKLKFGNIRIEDLSGGETQQDQTIKPSSSDPDILWSWQFTFPTPSKGREIAFPATYAKEGLGKAVLSRGVNAAPGAGSVRGFTAVFPIDGNIDHAKRSGSYYEFVLNTGEDKKVKVESIDVTLRRQEESPYLYRWAYSLDGKNFEDIGDKEVEITSSENLGVKQSTLDLTKIPDLQSAQGKVYFRLYAWGATSVTGGQRSFGFGKSNPQGSEVIVFKGKVN